MNQQRVRRAARQDPAQVAKVIEVQERQIEAMKIELAAMEAVLIGVAELYVYDHVHPETGEVMKGYQRPLPHSPKEVLA